MSTLTKIADVLRALPDEQLLEAAGEWIALKIVARGTVLEVRATARRPTAKLRRELAKKPRAKAPKVVERRRVIGPSSDNIERVAKVLNASPEALAPRDIAAKTGLDSSKTRYALVRLRDDGRAFCAGKANASRWGVTQAMADEAAE